MAKGCGYTARMFGAPYDDAICVDGLLWDLDSAEEGILTSGGEIPCPRCATKDWLRDVLESAKTDIPQPWDRTTPALVWERAVIYALDQSHDMAVSALKAFEAFELLDHPGRVDAPERPFEDDPGLVWRQWPWPVVGLSYHLRLEITPQPGNLANPADEPDPGSRRSRLPEKRGA